MDAMGAEDAATSLAKPPKRAASRYSIEAFVLANWMSSLAGDELGTTRQGPEPSLRKGGTCPTLAIASAAKVKLDFCGWLSCTRSSLYKYAVETALEQGAAFKGYLVRCGWIVRVFVCSFIATLGVRRQYAPSLALRCFMIFGILAIASSFRSFNPFAPGRARSAFSSSPLASVI